MNWKDVDVFAYHHARLRNSLTVAQETIERQDAVMDKLEERLRLVSDMAGELRELLDKEMEKNVNAEAELLRVRAALDKEREGHSKTVTWAFEQAGRGNDLAARLERQAERANWLEQELISEIHKRIAAQNILSGKEEGNG